MPPVYSDESDPMSLAVVVPVLEEFMGMYFQVYPPPETVALPELPASTGLVVDA